MNEVAEAVLFFAEVPDDAVDFSAVSGFEAAASGVGEHFFGEAADDLGLALFEHFLELDDVANLPPGGGG